MPTPQYRQQAQRRRSATHFTVISAVPYTLQSSPSEGMGSLARRRESLVNALLVRRWWTSVIVAATVSALLKFAAPLYFASSPYTAGIGTVAKNTALLIAGVFLLIGSLSFIRALVIKRKFNSPTSIEHVRQPPWRQFESLVGEAFRRRGYTIIENAIEGPDGGIELVLQRGDATFYLQCKQWKHTSRSDVRCGSLEISACNSCNRASEPTSASMRFDGGSKVRCHRKSMLEPTAYTLSTKAILRSS